ncbi:phosphoribosylglycinamide formyltransferase, partial [mine drainage metagenome]
APLRLAILISGRGSNMAAIAHACRERRIAAEVAVVLSERPEAQGLTVARELGLDARAIAWPGAARRAEFERAAT